MTEPGPPPAAALELRGALRAMGRGDLLAAREGISNALRLLEAAGHTPVNPCPKCSASTTYLAGAEFMCATCGNVWNPFTQPVDNGMAANDARPGGITADQRRSLEAAFAMLGVGTRGSQLLMANVSAGRAISDLGELSYNEAARLSVQLVDRARDRRQDQ